jgi:hypothetical protein
VNSPVVETDPAVAFQVTLVFAVLLTRAVNCWVFPDATAVEFGLTETVTGDGFGFEFEIVTVAVPEAAGLIVLTAVTVTDEILPKRGARKRPVLEISPALARQETFWFAENCCVLPGATVAADGLTVTEGAGPGVGFDLFTATVNCLSPRSLRGWSVTTILNV